MITLDGTIGEGGGQVLRSALSLSALTGKPFHLFNIRAGRPRPGLQPQHLTAVNAAAAICGAQMTGNTLGSKELFFHPGEITAGRYHFDIGTAGSTGLIVQTLFPPLARAASASEVTITGGTHVPWSPCFHYLERQWLPHVVRLGFRVGLKMERAGFYPKGGGRIRLIIEPTTGLQTLQLTNRGNLVGLSGWSAVANLPLEIAERQKEQALRRLGSRFPASIVTTSLSAYGKGTVLLLHAVFDGGGGCFFSLGQRGKRAEQVADEAADELLSYLASGACIDSYLADQLLLPLAMVPGRSAFSCERNTLHLRTNAEIVRRFLPAQIAISESPDGRGYVEVTGVSVEPATH